MRKWFLLFVIFALFFCISSCFAEDVNNTDCFEINSSDDYEFKRAVGDVITTFAQDMLV